MCCTSRLEKTAKCSWLAGERMAEQACKWVQPRATGEHQKPDMFLFGWGILKPGIVPLSQKHWMTSVVAVCGATRFIIRTRVWILKWSDQRECRSGNRGFEGDVRGTIRFARSDLCCCARSHYNYTRGAPRGHGGVRLARAKMFILEQLFITRAVREKSYQPSTRQRNIISARFRPLFGRAGGGWRAAEAAWPSGV